MKELYTAIEIDAPAERVWAILTDFARFPEWNPTIRRARGELRPGARLEVHQQPPGYRGRTSRPAVVGLEPGCEFRWLGQVGPQALFSGEHIFAVEPLAGGRVRFVQREEFRGLLVPILWRTLNTRTRSGFEAMNRALKARAEQMAASDSAA